MPFSLVPYVGITDFMNRGQVNQMLAVLEANRKPGSCRKLHVGVMMSRKTLHGAATRWAPAFPRNEHVAGIFPDYGTPNVYNCLHYVDRGEGLTLREDLPRAIGYGGAGLHAIQLDMIWPDPEDVKLGVHISRRTPEVILQIGREALAVANDNPATVVRRLEAYDGIIHRVLLDKSMGQGIGMDADVLAPFARAIRARFPDVGLTFAGGLGPGTVGLVKPLLQEVPDLSIDAQAKLRPSWNALDPVNWKLAEIYLIEALRMLD